MATVTVHEAKTHLSKLIARVLAGEDVTIARGKEEVVKLIPAKPLPPKRRTLGWLAHEVPPGRGDILEHGFWDPLSNADMGYPSDDADDR
ncbi:MAG TPA: type II toxin-antitoxin system prevent-host-death family antitoxin [Sphingomicrobium sp.]|jgi:prevent-host-death family protein